jgi:hypothetical protein
MCETCHLSLYNFSPGILKTSYSVNKLPMSTELKVSLYSQMPNNFRPYPKTNESSHIHLHHPSGLSNQGFSVTMLYTHCIFPLVLHATSTNTHFMFLALIRRSEEYTCTLKHHVFVSCINLG